MEIEAFEQDLPISHGTVILRPMLRRDVDEMALWSYHLDPFYSKGARLPASSGARDRWWNDHVKSRHSTLLGATDEKGMLIGRVSVTLVDGTRKEGVMGIRIRPDLENQGFGTDLMNAFLEYWFLYREMEILSFDANSLNERAIACYKKVGIRIVGYHFEYHPHYIGEKDMPPTGFLKHFDYRISRDQFLEQRKKPTPDQSHPV